MGLFSFIIGAPNPSTPEEIEASAAWAGGDPAMAAVALGHDYAETVNAQAEIAAAESAKGGVALTAAERDKVLAAHPAADRDLATAGTRTEGQTVTAVKAAAKAALRTALDFLGRLGRIAKWTVLVLLVVLVLVLARRLYKLVAG